MSNRGLRGCPATPAARSSIFKNQKTLKGSLRCTVSASVAAPTIVDCLSLDPPAGGNVPRKVGTHRNTF